MDAAEYIQPNRIPDTRCDGCNRDEACACYEEIDELTGQLRLHWLCDPCAVAARLLPLQLAGEQPPPDTMTAEEHIRAFLNLAPADPDAEAEIPF